MVAFAAAAPVIGGALSALGGFFGGNAQKKASEQQVKEQKREFNLGNWQSAARGAETSGLRDKLLTMFGQIAQQGPQRFTPRDAFNPVGMMNGGGQGVALAQPQAGGMNPNQLSLPQNYQMGDGGVNADVYTSLLQQLGYKAPDHPDRLRAAADLEARKRQYQQSIASPPPRLGGKFPTGY